MLGRLGPALDGPGDLAEYDVWYCILEGTSEPSVAEAQALAITELAARAATDLASEPRAMLLAADDYSAVSRRVPLSNLYERGRSLGIGVQVSAQSWEGLGRDDDERYRIAATADGGIWVLGTPHPEPLSGLAGHRRVLETAHRLVGNAWGDEGLTREQRAWVADPDLIRRLDIGQACYIHRGAATFVQVARPTPSPLSLPAAQAPVAAPGPRPGKWARRQCAGGGAAGLAPARAARRRGRPRPGRRAVSANPFDALGLPVRRDLTDEQVRGAWRRVATATHPDRADGGDLARYTTATAAYVQLRTPWGRSEAYADVAAAADDTSPLPVVSEASADPLTGPPVGPLELLGAYTWQLPARIRQGRPLRLLIRAGLAALACRGVLALIPGHAAGPFLVAALVTWFVVTGRSDLARPRHR